MNEIEKLRKELEEIKSQVSCYQQFTALSSNVFIIVDKNLTIIEYLNQNSYVYESRPVQGVALEDCVRNELYTVIKKKLKKVIERKRKIKFEVTLKSKKGDSLWFSVSIEPNRGNFSILVEDISSLKHKHKREIENDRLATLGVMTGGIAHQFNNIHNVVLGSLECLSFIDDEKSKNELVDMAILNIKKASNLTHRLLHFARPSDREVVLEDLEKLAVGAYEFVEEQFENFRSKFVIENKITDQKAKVKVEAALIEQVLINIYINGLHSMVNREDREIKVCIHADENSRQLYCDISDKGCGILKTDVEKIFTPLFSTKGEFAQDNNAMSSLRGTGLGLSISKKIMKEMSGDLKMIHTGKEGTTFRLSFPLVMASEVLSELDKSKGKEGPLPKDLKVMIVEDSIENRNLVKFYLNGLPGTSVKEYENGDVPKNELEDFSPDYILLDWLMPEVGGDVFLSRLVQWNPDALKKVGVITGNVNEPSLEKWKDEVKFVLKKPVTRNGLISTLLN